MIKDFEILIMEEDAIDVRIVKENNRIEGFVLNLRCKFGDVWYQVYRIDTCHGYLHEQRFWISPEPAALPMQEAFSLEYVFNFYMNQIKQNFEKYRKYYEERMKP